jgi:hypothetical protein
MSRGLFRFLIFCVSLLVVGIAGALVLGQNKLQFLFHAERSSQEFVMLGFAKADMQGQAQTFNSALDALLLEAEGEVLWSGRVVSVLEGREADNWPALAFSLYPSRSAFIKQYTKDSFVSPFGVALPNQSASLILAASPEQNFVSPARVYLVELFQLNTSQNDGKVKTAPVVDALLLPGMQDVWTASVNPLDGASDRDWQFVRMTGFESRQALTDWLDSIERKTQASLQKRYYRHYVALIVDAFEK